MRWILAVVGLAWAAPLAAQQDTTRVPTGVELGMIYSRLERPRVAVRPLASRAEAMAAAEQVHAIVERDLDYSDRFLMVRVPPSLAVGPVLYEAWNDLNVVYLVTGELEADGDGYLLRVAVHDIVYGSLKKIQAFELPAPSAGGFRMAVHAAADEVVLWLSGEPGMAASRVAAVRVTRNAYELIVVDSDGENVQRLVSTDRIVYSPAWSPDGNRLAYAVGSEDGWAIHERDLRTGNTRVLRVRAGAQLLTPSYSPDGRRIAFALSMGGNTEIHDYDVVENCCLRRLTRGPGLDVSPAYAPDGRRLAFNSDRLGQPHIYVIGAEGGEATLITPYTYGERNYFTSPDWSPTDSLIALHGRSRGLFQVMVVPARPGAVVRQLTLTGENEDPTWAPDGRHLAYSSVRPGGGGVYVIDVASGRERPLLQGGRFRLPAWSPTLMRAATVAADSR